MSFSKVFSAQINLVKANIVDIEVDISKNTLFAFSVVGLPDKAVEESRDRVSAAIKNSGFVSPKNKNEKTIVSLAPADLKKEGPNFDLGIAMAYMLASGDIEFDPNGKLFLGELALNGELRKIKGTLALVQRAKQDGFSEVFLPKDNATEGALIDGIKIFGVKNLKEIIEHLNEKEETLSENVGENHKMEVCPKTEIIYKRSKQGIDFADIKGQETAKRGLEIAASGGHNIAMWGPPGTGKTMLAKAFCHILPPLSFDEILEVTSIHSIAGILQDDLVVYPPFRSPHHTASYVSIVGGGAFPKPGEVTLAHKGVLFTDEFPEFDRRVIDSLRQPFEDNIISISRAKGSAVFPASFILIAAMNPCPCGNYKSGKECKCSVFNIERYQKKISGPIVDRIDMWVEVSKIDHRKLSEKDINIEKTEKIRERVIEARNTQEKRFGAVRTNGKMSAKDIDSLIYLDDSVKDILNQSALRLDLSPRAYHKIIKVARTIADLEKSKDILPDHLLEALQYRPRQQF